ncbi:MAG TPA: hypothetical protein VHC67_17410, partial [Gaiellaceae bacterium]|nr:hypothetical protein [Gaiellaceae bacterium]
MAPAIAAIVAAFIAGHPVNIACDADTAKSPTPPPPGYVVESWTQSGGSVSHFLPSLCTDMGKPVGSTDFAHGLATLIHESAIARGV